MDRPKSPRSALPTNVRYCTGSGRSSPSSRRTRSISLVGASGGRSSGTGSPDRRMTTKTTVVTSQTATSARRSLGARKPRTPRIGYERPGPRCLGPRPFITLGALELEVELPDLELLVRIGPELDVLLKPVVLVRLDDRQPGEVLEEDRGHLLVGLRPELLVHREARGVAQLVPLRVAPVVLGTAGTEQPPHHPVGIAQRGGRIRPEHALERLLAILLGAHGVLDDLDLGVDAGVLPHALDRFRHLLVVGQIGDRRLDDDLFVLVAGLLQQIARRARLVGQRRQRSVPVVVALGDRLAGHDPAPAPQLLHDGLAV